MDIATLSGCPRKIILSCGESVHVSPLKVRDWGQLQAWLRDNVPSPLAVAQSNLELVPMAKEDRQSVLSHAALQPWPPRVGGRGWLEAIDRAEDQVACALAVLRVVLRDEVRAQELVTKVTGADFREIFSAAMGLDEPAPKV